MYSNFDWWERLQNSWERFTETTCQTKVYFPIMLTTIAINIYARMQILKLPHPETFIEYFKFAIFSPEGYWGTCLLTLIAFGFCFVLSAATLGWGILYREELRTVFSSLIFLSSAAIMIWGLYILSYFILLFGVIVVSAVVMLIYIKLSD